MIRIIPGEAGPRHLTALVITADSGLSSLSIDPLVTGTPSPGPIHRGPETTVTDGERTVRVLRLRVGSLQPNTPYQIVATSGSSSRETIIETLMDASAVGDNGFSLVAWSCFHDETGSAARIRSAVNNLTPQPSFKILLGDNIYLDQPLHMSDPRTEFPRRYIERFHGGSFGATLEYLPTLTTWDDHEFWNNYPQSQVWLSQSHEHLRETSIQQGLSMLDTFQHSLNPPTPPTHRSYRYEHAPLASFFVADIRTQRDVLPRSNPKMMPDDALADLVDWAATLTRPGILVLGQPLWMSEGSYFDYNPPRFRAQYDAIWQAIDQAPFDIMILSGDIHYSRLLRFKINGGRSVYECITSPAQHIPEGSATVKFSLEPPYSLIPGDPEFASYEFGTDVESSIAELTFKPLGPERVSVGIKFLDLRNNGRPAENRYANLSFTNRRGTRPRIFPEPCHLDPALELGRRLST